MKKLLIVGAVTLALGLFVILNCAGYMIGKYNSFTSQNQSVSTAWSQVETQYQRRYDLIPNLVEAVKGSMRQEQTVFKAIADARTHYAGTASGSAARIQAAGGLDSAFARLMVVMENYPELKSNERVKDLMDELAGTENRINVARYRYNEVTQGYNTSIMVFPGKLIASAFNFQPRVYYEAEATAKNAPKVNLEIKS